MFSYNINSISFQYFFCHFIKQMSFAQDQMGKNLSQLCRSTPTWILAKKYISLVGHAFPCSSHQTLVGRSLHHGQCQSCSKPDWNWGVMLFQRHNTIQLQCKLDYPTIPTILSILRALLKHGRRALQITA